MPVIKHFPADFMVEEQFKPNFDETGKYACFVMEKRGLNTQDAIGRISRASRIPFKFFGYAGMKDRNAVTTQIISVRSSPSRLENISVEGVKLKFIGMSNDPVTLGSFEGNKFSIVIRDIEDPVRIGVLLESFVKDGCVFNNYYGEQRFNSSNHLVGRAIVMKDFSSIAALLGLQPSPTFVNDMRKNFEKKIILLFVHSYQSFLFNEALSEISREGSVIERPYSAGVMVFGKCKNFSMPIVGFGTELEKFEPEVAGIVSRIMDREGVKFRDFVIRQFPEASCEGSERKMCVKADGFSYKFGNDEVFGSSKCTLSFSLPKGCYATVLIKLLFGI